MKILRSKSIGIIWFSLIFLPYAAVQGQSESRHKTELPVFWKTTLAQVEETVQSVKKGQLQKIAVSPGGRPVYAVFYGEKDAFHSQANYNSAGAARNPAFYAEKDSSSKPVVYFLGPVHGQEVEGIVGLLNLIRIAETGKDYRGKPWKMLSQRLEKCRIIIIPCGNPDGRERCRYDSWVGVATDSMTKYGQGTRKDSSFYRWPGAKAVHPMKGDVGFLGAYFNDAGINPMHDNFFDPMAAETRAILKIAEQEAPDISVSLHSHESEPVILQPSYLPYFYKKKVTDLSGRLKSVFFKNNLPYGNVLNPIIEDKQAPLKNYFNLTSALHHISGTLSFTFECSHGSISHRHPQPLLDHEQILDVQLLFYDEMIKYILENRMYWTKQAD